MLTLEPIGIVRSPYQDLSDAPRQPRVTPAVSATIALEPGRHFEDALDDLSSWEYLWVLFWFHRAGGFRPKVLPPRSAVRRGLFATRSPHRPNPIGMSAVKLVAVRGLCIDIAEVDMVDGTPVLDIKPYVPWADIVPASGSGWLDAPPDPDPGYAVRWDARAEEQLAFLEAHGIALRAAVAQRLALGPQPHAYRRIRVRGDARELAYKAWRFAFAVDGRDICVLRIRSGYRARALAESDDPALDIHRRFNSRFGPG